MISVIPYGVIERSLIKNGLQMEFFFVIIVHNELKKNVGAQKSQSCQ